MITEVATESRGPRFDAPRWRDRQLAPDHGLFGPREPLGFSGGFRLGLLSGMPTFKKLRFTVGSGGAHLELHVR